MPLTSIRRLVLFVALTSFACGCSSAPTTPTPTQITVRSVTVSGNASFTDGGQTSQFTATAMLSNGLMQDQTRAAAWLSSNTAVATIDRTGLVTSIRNGQTQISATYQSVSGTKTVNVTVPTDRPGAPSKRGNLTITSMGVSDAGQGALGDWQYKVTVHLRETGGNHDGTV